MRKWPSVRDTIVTITTPIASSKVPALSMSIMLSFSLPKTIAFGGVATGNIKAHEAAIVAGSIRIRGLTPIAVAREYMIGKIRVVVAVFEVNSVKIAVVRAIVPTISQRGAPLIKASE